MSMYKHIQYTKYIIIKKREGESPLFTTSPKNTHLWEALRRQTERIP